MHSLELLLCKREKPDSEGQERLKLVGHVSLEELWKSLLHSMAHRIGFQEKGLGWGPVGAALGWLCGSPCALAWPGGKAEILIGWSSLNSDSTSESAHEHGWGSP